MKLTIITVCYNDISALKITVDSVISQFKGNIKEHTKDIEYIVIDGGSNDGTLEYLEDKKKSCFGLLKYISESDSGIYDAMNKGICNSNGEWVQFLNAGDTYYDVNVLLDVIPFLKSDYGVIYGDALKYDDCHEELVKPHSIEKLSKGMILCHQALFFNNSGKYDISYDLQYKIVSDYNTVLRLFKQNARFLYIDRTIVKYDMMGVSAVHLANTFKEICDVRRNQGVIEVGIKGKCLYVYGIIKRRIIEFLPPKIRWKIVAIKRKILNKESLY